MDNTALYNRILNGQETKEDIVKFNNMCQDYSDIYKDINGFRPRDEESMCVNAYSGTPDIEKFRELLKNGINPLAWVYDTNDEEPDYMDDWMQECADRDFMNSDVSKEQILDRHPEYEQYFV